MTGPSAALPPAGVLASVTARIRQLISSPPLMLAYSNLARAVSYVLPVPLLYRASGASAAAFWLLVTTLIGLQNLLFLGAPQILIRMLAVAHVHEAEEAGSDEPTTQDIRALMQCVFFAAGLLITVLMATVGSHFVAPVVAVSANPRDLWAAWAVIVASSPVRIVLLRQLTYLNGRGELALPRFVDGTAWGLSGVIAFASLLASRSLLAMTLAAQVPIVASLVINAHLARRHGWTGWRGLTRQRLRKTAARVWPPTWRAGLGVLLSTGVRQGSGVLLARYIAAGPLAGYLLAQNGIAVIMMLSSSPIQSSIHQMARAFARQSTDEHVVIAESATRRSLWIAALACGGIALVIPLLPMLHVSRAFVPVSLWAVLSAGLFLQRYGAAHLQHYSITNHIVWHWLDGATGLINLLLCMLWMPGGGAFGAAWANTASLVCVYAWVPTVMVVRRFGIRWPRCDLTAALVPCCVLAALISVAYALQAAA